MTSPPVSAPLPATEPRPVAVLLDIPVAETVPPPLLALLGERHAIRLLRVFARRTLRAIEHERMLPQIWYAPADAGREMARWLGPQVLMTPRPPGSIAVTIPYIAQEAVGKKWWLLVRPVGVGVPASVMAEARDALDSDHIVFGATEYGSLYLLGGPASFAPMAASLPWGHSSPAVALREHLRHGAQPYTEVLCLGELLTEADLRHADLLT